MALGLSIRQVRRLKGGYEREGIGALVHGNRGRRPHHCLSKELKARVLELATGRYAGCNDQHLSELLGEREKIKVSRPSVRRILRAAGIRSPRKRRVPKHRSRRERMPQEGMLLQIDGSRHDWLESRGPYLTLVGGIDDATGKVPYGVFREQEDAQGYFLLLEHIVRTLGRPVAVYRDGHGIFERSTRGRLTIAEQLGGKPDPTQFGRLLEELEIGSIPARSPQAKGRIERLWGTFQDRLVAELRLAGASTLAEANLVLWEFLPRYNTRFAVPAAQEGLAYRPLEPTAGLEERFCFKYERTVGADNTVQLGEHRLQLLPSCDRISYARCRVEVQERMDGSLAVSYQAKQIAFRPAPLEAPLLRVRGNRITRRNPAPEPALGPLPLEEALRRSRPDNLANGVLASPGGGSSSPPRPGPNHPWRRLLVSPEDKITEQLRGQNH